MTTQVNNMNTDFRPKTFDQVIGQEEIKENLKLKITAFKKTQKSPVHMLFLGFSGAGKTTLANVVANEMGVTFHQVMATRIKNWNDFYSILRNVEENDVLFIDEIHALSGDVQENLYGVMEDFKCTIEDKNLQRQRIINLPKFTLIGATTHTGDLKAALLSRFQYKGQLVPYTVDELTNMVITAGDRVYGLDIPYDIALRIAQLSRKTARVCYTLLRHFVDIAEASTPGKVSKDMLNKTLLYKMLRLHQIDPIVGLDYASRKYIVNLIRESRPIGSKSLANLCQEQESTVISMIEPFLLSEINLEFVNPSTGQTSIVKSPFVRITSKGRIALEAAYKYIKLCQSLQKQGWFNNESLNVKPE